MLANIFTPNDISKFYEVYLRSVVGYLEDVDKNEQVIYPWSTSLASDKCMIYTPDTITKCFGCTMLERFNPQGETVTSNFELMNGPREGQGYIIKESKSGPFRGYTKKNDPNMDATMDRFFGWNHTYDLYGTSNQVEHHILIYILMSDKLLYLDHFTHFYICRDRCVYLTKSFNYGSSTLSELVTNVFTSHEVSNVRYLNREIIEGIIYQLYYMLQQLSVYEYTHGSPSMEYLSYSDETFNSEIGSYPFTVYLEPTCNDTMVIDGRKYLCSSDVDVSQLNDMSNKEIAIHCRNHEGVSLDHGKYEFICLLGSLYQDDIFNRSVKMFPELESLVEDTSTWDRMVTISSFTPIQTT